MAMCCFLFHSCTNRTRDSTKSVICILRGKSLPSPGLHHLITSWRPACGASPALGTPLELLSPSPTQPCVPVVVPTTYQSLQMGPRLEPRTTMWSNLPNHQHETMKEGIPSESQSDSTNASAFKTILPACTASASCWQFASTAPELALDGQLPLPAGIPLPLAFRFPRPRAGAGWAASASCWHER